MREHILSEIRRLATANGGQPPGKRFFETETGIREGQWSGRYWARWSDALAEAGLSANAMNPRYDNDFMLQKLIEACRHYGKIPTYPELRLYRRNVEPGFPEPKTVWSHFGGGKMPDALRAWISGKHGFADIAAMLPDEPAMAATLPGSVSEGLVYLLRSGSHYKVGRSDEIERRVKEITVALPETVTLVHTIRTDDPAGIEAYWHRRFADRRANGEWFKLTPGDVAAFKRRRFQ